MLQNGKLEKEAYNLLERREGLFSCTKRVSGFNRQVELKPPYNAARRFCFEIDPRSRYCNLPGNLPPSAYDLQRATSPAPPAAGPNATSPKSRAAGPGTASTAPPAAGPGTTSLKGRAAGPGTASPAPPAAGPRTDSPATFSRSGGSGGSFGSCASCGSGQWV